MTERTQFLVLRKTPYRDSDLIVTGVSPDYGQLDLIGYGAQKIGEKKFPVLDLFNELDVGFEPSENGMAKLVDADLLTNFAPVADKIEIYRLAGKIAALVLKNSAPEMPMAIVYDTLRHVLGNLALNASGRPALWQPDACGAVIKLAILQENGMLPEFDKPEVSELFDAIIEAGMEGSELPKCQPGYWRQLTLYLNTLFPNNA